MAITKILFAFLSLFGLIIGRSWATQKSVVPAIFIFGDSTADVGNNNFLSSSARANFPHNGIDFVHQRATGRFSNGLITADFLAKMYGFNGSPPPLYSITRGQQAHKGVNFASAASGILQPTGNKFGDRISMPRQLRYFGLVRDYFVKHFGATETEDLFANSIFFISTGSNDLIEFFAAHGSLSYAQKSEFIKLLVSTYKLQLLRAFNATGGCLEGLNELSYMFYEATSNMLNDLSCEVKGLKYSLGNLFEMVIDFFQKAPLLGFTELENACCGAGKFNGEAACTPNATVCSNRSQYLFWDSACKIAAGTLFVGLASANAPAIFVFGDSLADVGNNNNLNVPLDKLANFPPNGIDFPLKTPTGRFSNGYNTIDYLAQQMGYKQSPPSFLSVENGANISQGVNFASGGSGILDTTGPAITFTAQISNFKSVIYDLTKQMGKEKAEEFISKSLFFISAGNNDMFAYYSTTGAQNITQNEQFVTSLVEKFSQHIKALYIYGARKFGTIGLSHIGCIPLMRSKNPIGKCNDNLNGLARNFNTAAQVRMNQLESMLKGMKYSYGNAYDLMSIAMATPFLLGYKDFQSACCGSGKFNGEIQCSLNTTLCSNRDQYFFGSIRIQHKPNF
ncbi:uncharacterized protein LOC109825513 [Asparagus officinalis]|uniref:uncharacterized protein LOC109825513 n=1 Tax=Asparagus officinalis TaxID=4686 RepID=UPI00098DE73F|nr:uncharacterized protein LOC109825513 [Asparagus officinalis]